ncbi:MAG: hypothetical protein WDM96_00550 [Lacunisphaera sp.]
MWPAASPSLRTYGLEKHFKFNIETNHATLAGHTFEHEIEVAAAQDMLGSIDANTGDLLLGWDTDQFNTNVKELTLAMVSILRAGAWAAAASTSTPSCAGRRSDPEDLFHAHIGGMDAYALAFKLARRILAEGKFTQFVADRYSSFDTGYGRDIETGKASFKSLEKLVLSKLGEPTPRSANRNTSRTSSTPTCTVERTDAVPLSPPMAVPFPFLDAGLPAGQRSADLIGRLTLPEKISQLLHDSPPSNASASRPTTGGTKPATASAATAAPRFSRR